MASKFTSHFPFSHSEDPPKDETSLTTLLTAEECADLTFLIATITASMRKSLLGIFVAEEEEDRASSSQFSQIQAQLPQEADKVPNAPDTSEAEAKLQKDRHQREEDARKELAKPEVQQLKHDMLHHFDEWRGKVIIRVGTIVNSREEAEHQKDLVPEKKVESVLKRQDTGMKTLKELDDTKADETKVLQALYPPIKTVLADLEEGKRALVLHSLVLILLSLETYSAHSRILVLYLTSSLGLELSVLKKDEETVARGLLEAATQQLNADAETKKRAEGAESSRKWKVGLASVAGAALIGVTGGLAAPLLAAGVGTVMGGFGLGATAAAGYLGTLAGSSVLVGGLFGAYGAKMTGQAMDDYAREVEDFGFIPVHHAHDARDLSKESRRLRVTICVSGWLTSKEEVVRPWRYISSSTEGFALRWELDALLNLGNALDGIVKSAAWSYAKKEIIRRTIFSTLFAGLWPLGLLRISKIIDNPFSIARTRADKAGAVLADALINKVQGERPMTLIGYSLGARVIYACLQSLAERKAFGLVENVVLLGAATPSDTADWRRIRSVVSGRVINVFSTNDYILAFLYRTSSIQYGVAGLQPILGVKGVQNVDVSGIVDGHLRYRYLTGSILKMVGFEDVDVAEVVKEEGDLKALEEEERVREMEAEMRGGEEEVEELEREVQRRNEEKKGGVHGHQV